MSPEASTFGGEQSVEELRRELAEARGREAATSEILALISRSPMELQGVFAEVAANAARLCDAYDATIYQADADELRLVAHHGPIQVGPVGQFTLPLSRGLLNGRAVLDRRMIQIGDLQAEGDEYPEGRGFALRLGFHTQLAIPLIRAGRAIGVISIRRAEVRLFTDRQIELLKTFADQAVIAIENARLFEEVQARTSELQESLEYQTATSEVLKVISNSPTNIKPVLDAICETAIRICGARDATLFLREANQLVVRAHYGPIENIGHLPISRDLVTGRALLERTPIHVLDIAHDPGEFPLGQEYALQLGYRTILAVPLIREDVAIGVIGIRRTEVRAFSDKQIKVLQTFADQAVIAIDNARLFEEVQARNTELRVALEQQTATSELLKVIGRSTFDLQPVFETLAENAVMLCEAEHAFIFLYDGHFLRSVASHNIPPALRAFVEANPTRPGRESAAGRAASERRTIHIEDIRADPEFTYGVVHVGPMRTVLAIPMLRADKLLGVIVITRPEVRLFTHSQIALMETFADQAVIAIENARLFEAEQASKRELQESLEQQIATSEVLQIISSSPGDLLPVFDAILANAVRLCEAKFGNLFLREGDTFRAVAVHGPPTDYVQWYRREPVLHKADITNVPLGRLGHSKKVIHILDLREDQGYLEHHPRLVALVESAGARTILGVPMLKGNGLIGAMFIYRQEVRPFTDKQIELVSNFARQAVIAIENTRLLNELRESLQQQTATADVLKVISRSALDLQRVLDALVESAARLTDANDAAVFRVFGDSLLLVAHHGQIPMAGPVGRHTLPRVRGHLTGRVVIDRRTIQVADMHAEADEYPESRKIALRLGYRTALGVPLIHASEAIGVILVRRTEVRPFTERQIELVNTFADQAVIAIENARLFEEVQARTRDLQESLEQQTAMSEVLSVISNSPGELQPVFEATLRNAVRICGAKFGQLFLFDGKEFRVVATRDVPQAWAEFLEHSPSIPADPKVPLGRLALTKQVVHIADITTEQAYIDGFPPLVAVAQLGGARTLLVVPMLKERSVIGAIGIFRQEVRPFSDKQIELVETFADQAVIAIENTRLFDQVQARNRDLTALGEVGRAVSSTLDLEVVLKTIVDRAVELSGTDGGSIFYYRGGRFELGETTGLNEEAIARFRQLDIAAGQTGLGEAISRRQPLQVPDIFRRPSNPLRDAAIEAGLRAGLIVPLFGSEGPLGALVLQRRRPGEFPAAVVSLMQAFADQSAIALENARLFEEIAQKSRDLELASQHKSQFVANMSHELRTPLAAMLGYAELLQEGIYDAPPEKFLPILTRIRSNGKHLLGLINTVLDISKIEAGQFKLNLGEYALSGIVETVMVATESLAATKKLAFKTEVAKGLPYGLGDEQRLTQVLLNLVGNAIKFTDSGEVRIAAGVEDGHFVLSVSDTGPGIPPEECERIFEKFRQVDSSNTRAKGGTGLGLAIAREIVEMHGGRIWVESTIGEGSTFRMELPVRAAAAAGAA